MYTGKRIQKANRIKHNETLLQLLWGRMFGKASIEQIPYTLTYIYLTKEPDSYSFYIKSGNNRYVVLQ